VTHEVNIFYLSTVQVNNGIEKVIILESVRRGNLLGVIVSSCASLAICYSFITLEHFLLSTQREQSEKIMSQLLNFVC
jgi:hypothetical protein